MHIAGPFFDDKLGTGTGRAKKTKRWFLSYFATVTSADGKPRKKRFRPYYESKDAAIADKPRIEQQHGCAGSTPNGLGSAEP